MRDLSILEYIMDEAPLLLKMRLELYLQYRLDFKELSTALRVPQSVIQIQFDRDIKKLRSIVDVEVAWELDRLII